MGAIEACRTAALGGHVERCEDCAHTRIAYNSCRNRSCPKCQAGAARDRLNARKTDLLPVAYFHVVFTMPAPIAAIAHHVHCIVPGSGLSTDGQTWIACRPGFFLPVRVLARFYRRVFLDKLVAAHRAGRLRFFANLTLLADAEVFANYLAPLHRIDWIVYAKQPFAGPEQVLAYLSRYTHRIAISNRRLIDLDETSVCFSWRDYRRGSKTRSMRVGADEFIRRFLLHILPGGFQRIRHYGFLANSHRRAKLACIRRLLSVPDPASTMTEDVVAPGTDPVTFARAAAAG